MASNNSGIAGLACKCKGEVNFCFNPKQSVGYFPLPCTKRGRTERSILFVRSKHEFLGLFSRSRNQVLLGLQTRVPKWTRWTRLVGSLAWPKKQLHFFPLSFVSLTDGRVLKCNQLCFKSQIHLQCESSILDLVARSRRQSVSKFRKSKIVHTFDNLNEE